MTNTTTTTTSRGWGRPANTNGYPQSAPYGQYQSNGHFFPNTITEGFNEQFDPSLNNLSQSMASMMLHGVDYTGAIKQNNPGAANGMTNMNSILPPQTNPGLFYTLPNPNLVYSDANGVPQSVYPQYMGTYGLNTTNSGQLQQASFQNLLANAPITPRGNGWMIDPQVPQEVPELAAPRRTSLSSNEADSPHTPMFTSYLGGYQPKVFGLNGQPNTLGNCSPFNPESKWQIAKTRTGQGVQADFEAWTSISPAIPPAIPAIDSPGGGRGTLEQIMHNPNGTTNVYVRGLHPDTTDEMLHEYGKRFGDIESAKSIIDTATGLCKG
ncbi:MAG: hypothetical protein Q9166_003300 [cf. Caloplaca sp. 2 TL-2023]